MTDLPELKKKVGDTIVVHYSSSYIAYMRKDDEIELLGEIRTNYLKNMKTLISYLEAKQIFNKTLQFSYDY